jgi:proteasome lid subunit RPN8/RPN11
MGHGGSWAMTRAVAISIEALRDVLAHAVQGYPAEVCGVLLGPRDNPDLVTSAVRMDNVQDRYHLLDPVQFPRTSRTAYRFNDTQHLKILKDAQAHGRVERVIYHSHVDAGAYFSAEDVAQALWDGVPRFPGVAYLVMGTSRGAVVDANLFCHEGGSFVGYPVDLSGARSTG